MLRIFLEYHPCGHFSYVFKGRYFPFLPFSVNVAKFAVDFRFYVNLHLHVQGNIQSRPAMSFQGMGALIQIFPVLFNFHLI